MAMMMGGKGKGKGSSRHNGKALVEMSSAAEAKNVIATLNGSELDGRTLETDTWTGSKKGGGKGVESNMVYVKNIAWKTRGWKLKEHFGQAGTVVHYKQMAERQKGGW